MYVDGSIKSTSVAGEKSASGSMSQEDLHRMFHEAHDNIMLGGPLIARKDSPGRPEDVRAVFGKAGLYAVYYADGRLGLCGQSNGMELIAKSGDNILRHDRSFVVNNEAALTYAYATLKLQR